MARSLSHQLQTDNLTRKSFSEAFHLSFGIKNYISLKLYQAVRGIKNMGVTFDSGNTFDNHIVNVCHACCYDPKDL